MKKVSSNPERKRSLLALPLTVAQIAELPSESVETNSLGATRGLQNPAMASYVARFGKASPRLLPPTSLDSFVPEVERPAILKTANDFELGDASDAQKIRAVERFFERDFRYTTYQPASLLSTKARTPLANFLLNTRAGHCEYFATATVLLLRQIGIPARYATGYAIQEGGGQGRPYIVRDRHAHAWTLAWMKDEHEWREVDTTPAGWEAAEEKELPPYQTLRKWWASFSFAFAEWRWLGAKGLFQKVAFGLLIPLIGFMGWRIFGKGFKKDPADWRSSQLWPGADSDLYALERRLAQNGLGRARNETTLQWILRIHVQMPDLSGASSQILSLHYRYRFDPAGIDPAEREKLKQLVRAILQKV